MGIPAPPRQGENESDEDYIDRIERETMRYDFASFVLIVLAVIVFLVYLFKIA